MLINGLLGYKSITIYPISKKKKIITGKRNATTMTDLDQTGFTARAGLRSAIPSSRGEGGHLNKIKALTARKSQ